MQKQRPKSPAQKIKPKNPTKNKKQNKSFCKNKFEIKIQGPRESAYSRGAIKFLKNISNKNYKTSKPNNKLNKNKVPIKICKNNF